MEQLDTCGLQVLVVTSYCVQWSCSSLPPWQRESSVGLKKKDWNWLSELVIENRITSTPSSNEIVNLFWVGVYFFEVEMKRCFQQTDVKKNKILSFTSLWQPPRRKEGCNTAETLPGLTAVNQGCGELTTYSLVFQSWMLSTPTTSWPLWDGSWPACPSSRVWGRWWSWAASSSQFLRSGPQLPAHIIQVNHGFCLLPVSETPSAPSLPPPASRSRSSVMGNVSVSSTGTSLVTGSRIMWRCWPSSRHGTMSGGWDVWIPLGSGSRSKSLELQMFCSCLVKNRFSAKSQN